MSACALSSSPNFDFFSEPHSWSHSRPLSLFFFIYHVTLSPLSLIQFNLRMDLQASAPTQSDRQLVSTRSQLPEFSCTLKPAISFESTTSNTDDEEKTSTSIPTPAQEVAITTLKDVEEEKVIAWLTLLRSIEPGFQHRSGPGCLSSEQIAALNILKDCQNGNVLAWLRYDLLAGWSFSAHAHACIQKADHLSQIMSTLTSSFLNVSHTGVAGLLPNVLRGLSLVSHTEAQRGQA
jgi:hypothetical protein